MKTKLNRQKEASKNTYVLYCELTAVSQAGRRVCPIRARLLSESTSIERPISGPSLSHSLLPKSLAILSEIRGRVVEDFVLFEKSVDIHPRLESKEPPKLRRG